MAATPVQTELEQQARTESEQQAIRMRVGDLFGIDLKPLQVNLIHHLKYNKTDLIFIGKTGFGKSIVFQSIPLLFDSPVVAIVLMPLKALQSQQCGKLSTISGARPFVLNGDTNTPHNLQAIREGAHTHVFTSPEIATSKQFNLAVLAYPEFQHLIKLVAIDEVHLVHEWRDFRPEYNALGVLRSRLPRGIPFLGVSATLDPVALDRIQSSLRYSADCEIIRTSIDRPEIYIQVECLKSPQKGMLDLQHLLPQGVAHYSQVPKTVIYIDTIAEICQGVNLFRKWMRQLGYPPDSERWISPYFADMAEDDKIRINELFERPAEDLDEPRILLASDAFGLGIDNKDIERVVQFRLPNTIQSLVQRMGRAMRGGKGQGRFLFLYPPWCYGPKTGPTLRSLKPTENEVSEGNDNPGDDGVLIDVDANEVDEVANDSIPEQSSRRTDGERRRDMDLGLYDIINGTGKEGDCIRLRLLGFFADATYGEGGAGRPTPCCSECDEPFRSSTDPHEALQPPSVHGSAIHVHWYRVKLQAWREDKAFDACAGSRFGIEPSIVMSDEYLDATARYGTHIKNLSDLVRWAGAWTEMDRYGADVLGILGEGRVQSLYRSEVVDVWRARDKGKRRKHDVAAVPASSEDLRAQRKEAWLITKGFKPKGQLNEQKGRRGSPKPTKDKRKAKDPKPGKPAKAKQGAKGKKAVEEARPPDMGQSSEASSSQAVVDVSINQQLGSAPLVERSVDEVAQPTSLPAADTQRGQNKAAKRKKGGDLLPEPSAVKEPDKSVALHGGEGDISYSSRGRKRVKKKTG